MKIKTLKIKVERENQEFDFLDFFEGNNTIFATIAALHQEKDGLYWHAFITYEPRQHIYVRESTEEKKMPAGFEEALRAYIEDNPPKKIRSWSAVRHYPERVLEVKELQDFARFKGLGALSLAEDNAFFTGVIELVKQYQSTAI